MTDIHDLREAICEALHAEKAYMLPQTCEELGLKPGTESEAFQSKKVYVRKRLGGKTKEELLDIADKVLELHSHKELNELLNEFDQIGVDGEVKNLIFASIGPKPEIVINDSVSNEIEIVEHEESCLVYDRPLPREGLMWTDLTEWWADMREVEGASHEVERDLYSRLKRSLESDAEERLFHSYYTLRNEIEGPLPALVPQVYLHYDPKTAKELGGIKRLIRQRMDFLLLFSDSKRIVVEVDGKHHYSENGRASPERYSEMVSEDRDLRLSGYELYRFGGYELLRNESDVEKEVAYFFRRLFRKHGVV
ncbi:endonuclease domain-containing protein [Salinibacter sp.]|uniref:endonuclease domain-containing protein n=1 Tax=Salinibacter sp. TaxID=2065818 RepID=UPI0021E798EB|nr:endonuclease domain-containing protein [Salinibacter sp.]